MDMSFKVNDKRGPNILSSSARKFLLGYLEMWIFSIRLCFCAWFVTISVICSIALGSIIEMTNEKKRNTVKHCGMITDNINSANEIVQGLHEAEHMTYMNTKNVKDARPKTTAEPSIDNSILQTKNEETTQPRMYIPHVFKS